MASRRNPDTVGSRDPFELDRLAEELAARESSAPGKKVSGFDDIELPEVARDLPVCAPLSHDDQYLSAETFDVEQFLLSRAYTSLPDLRTELRDYLATLKEELVKLINDDYEAFISLSTDLRGEGTRLESMKRPLTDMKARVLVRRTYSMQACIILIATYLVVRVGSTKYASGHPGRDQGEARQACRHPRAEGVPPLAAQDLGVHYAARESIAHHLTRRCRQGQPFRRNCAVNLSCRSRCGR